MRPIFQPVPASVGCGPLTLLPIIILGVFGARGDKLWSWIAWVCDSGRVTFYCFSSSFVNRDDYNSAYFTELVICQD